MKSKILSWGQVLIGLILVSSCSSSEKPINPTVSSLTESVYASVTVQPERLYNVHSAVSGIVEKIFVEEGDTVKAGSPLLQITNSHPQLNLQNAKLVLDLAQQAYEGRSNMLNELKDEIAIARLKLANDSVNFVRQENLWKKNIGTQNAYEAKELAFNTSKSNLALLLNRYQRTEEDLSIQLEQAQNNYKSAQNTKGDYTLRSNMDGRVYAMNKEPGESVSQQEPVAILGDATSFVVEMQIDEVDIARIDLGQTVMVSLDAYPQQAFEARVSKIFPQKNEATQTFTVEAVFKLPPEKLFPGLSGEANIVIMEKGKALVIPRAYLTADNQVKTADGLITVRTGLKDMDGVEVLSGIDSTTQLYLPKQ
ncbi:efflux RND transporter periplasmic adaptor subunit [Roseivirga echinicomitans]|uniref:efflux RND transporter periplasmic adaptor subunit n=1 Tax=Roseivirga echinicomitans TaxID=296218 RepID=UPI001FDF8D17|nr:efflux RND transporter periplasmic adaptor subunit [Roseivirga echinicomitans]